MSAPHIYSAKVLTILLLAAISTLYLVPSSSFAQASSDTLYVSAMPPGNINNVIAGDTTATGARKDPNRVYVLQQTGSVDTTYFFTATINMGSNFNGVTLTIIGKNNPVTGMPPVIEPFILTDNSTPAPFTECRAGNISVDNLYFLGKRTDGLISSGNNRFFDGTPVHSWLRINHCVFDEFTKESDAIISYGGDSNSFYIKNTEFRNLQDRAFWQPTVIFAEAADTLQLINNTYFGIGIGIWGNDNLGYFDFEHNTMVGCAWWPFRIYQVDTAVISDNIFYATYAGGLDSASIKYGGLGNESPSVISLDSLFQFALPPYNLTEAGRNIVVKNNAYFWPNGIDSTIAAINDTAKNKIVPPTWMNSQTAAMFSNKTAWPGLSEANNDSVDPGFLPSIVNPMVASLDSFTVARWNGTVSTSNLWRQFITNPANVFGRISKNWATTQGYPVPENFAYSNTTLQTAGSGNYALGDLNWYPAQLKEWEAGQKVNAINQTKPEIPAKFSLSQNYPNPFNPSTDIRVSLDKPGVMSLRIYNVLGQLVDVVDQGFKVAGTYNYSVSMDKYASGVYFYTLQQGSNMMTRKMLLLK
jgi:hypothetical protein